MRDGSGWLSYSELSSVLRAVMDCEEWHGKCFVYVRACWLDAV